MPGPVVAYWEIRGLGAPLRMLCEYAGAEYENKMYKCKEVDGGWDKSDWFDAKPALKDKNALMNLPHVIDGDVVVSQTLACFSYLGKKFGLYGSTPADAVKVDQILCEAQDLRNAAVGCFYSSAESFETRKDGHYKAVKGYYGKFELWLTQQGTAFTAGPAPTAGDFHLWEMLDQHEAFAQKIGKPSLLGEFPKLKALHAALKAEPKLQKYFEGPMYALTINQKFGSFY
eukprot:CAMPEP_0171235218 /NCGR_PEP_ID=MMETSP0790-20130122/41833_1 /TAXON_ID=2925 /ORGANISM="Alexandrium catenella, Strain OF101" /LENGTH=228 /DNA_ID=CAMNT_0011701523 /DNA_START=181 /DNA_END=867 /DNA_ORIENTATION=-